MKELSTYLTQMPLSSIRKLLPYARAAKAAGKTVYHLNIGQPDIETPAAYYEKIRAFSDSPDAYMPSEGIAPLREKVAEYYKDYGAEITADDITITTGGTEGFMFTILSLTNPADEVLIFEPYYSNYNTVFALGDINPVPVTTKVENGFHFRKEDLLARLTSKTKLILVTNPGNPTGAVLTREEIDAIIDVAIEHDLYVVCDEVYREIVFGARPPHTFLSEKKILDRLVVVDSVSKRFSACGVRIGMAITKNEKIKELIYKLCSGRLSVSTVEQNGAIGLYESGRKMIDFVRETFLEHRNVVSEMLASEKDIVCPEPEGAFYSVLKLPVANAEDFLIWMLSEFDDDGETVMAAPAEGFYATKGLGKNEIRIAYVLAPAHLRRAMEILLKGLRAYNGGV